MKKLGLAATALAVGITATSLFASVATFAEEGGTKQEQKQTTNLILSMQGEEEPNAGDKPATQAGDTSAGDNSGDTDNNKSGTPAPKEGESPSGDASNNNGTTNTGGDSDTPTTGGTPTTGDGTLGTVEGFTACTNVFKSFDGKTIKYGVRTGATNGASYIAWEGVDYTIKNAMYEDKACAAEISAKHSAYTNVLVKFTNELDYVSGSSTPVYLTVAFYNGESDTSKNTNIAKINLTTVLDSSKASTAASFISDMNKPLVVSGADAATVIIAKNKNYNPLYLSHYKTILAKYQGATLTTYYFTNENAIEKIEGYERSLEGTTTKFGFYLGGVYYGYVSPTVVYSQQVISATQNHSILALYTNAADVPSGSTFNAVRQSVTEENIKKAFAGRDSDKIFAAYGFSIVNPSGVAISNFKEALFIYLPLGNTDYSNKENIYARYITADGQTPDADIPVTLACDSGKTDCTAFFPVTHFSTYAIIETDNPITDASSTTGAKPSVDKPDTGFFTSDAFGITSSILAALLGTSAVVFVCVYRARRRATPGVDTKIER